MEPRYWDTFCELIERPQWKSLLHKRSQYEAELGEIFLTRDRDEWIALFRKAGTQGAPVLSLTEALDDSHARARGVVTTTHDDAGNEITHIGPLIKMSATPGAIRHVARMPGADSRAILSELGFEGAQLERMIDDIAANSDVRLRPYLNKGPI
jgi:crotonobetainyl-CoA:carnitine CoA-transferase CaiB-like acyl-CoA transferase